MTLVRTFACALLCAWFATPALAQSSAFDTDNMPYRAFDTLPVTHILVGGSTILVGYTPGSEFALSKDEINAWVERCARIVASYYGRFPVATYRLLIIQDAGTGIHNGTTYGYRGGATKLHLGRSVQLAQLNRDWVLIHEMIHLALPEVGDRHHWIEEGIAVYVESIARMQANALDVATGWGSLVEGMPKGEPQFGDAGLDNTHTWGRTYWGGALFCLVADIRIRERTGNKMGLQDALRGILNAGGNIESDWNIDSVLKIADKATGTHVLQELYAQTSASAVDVDLPALWKKFGISVDGSVVYFDDKAPQADIRKAITSPPH
jgi:hypothetical protein